MTNRADYTHLQQAAVYPGHAVTLALCIIRHYPNYDAAFEKNKYGDAAALASSSIPGAGGNVGNALWVLKYLKDGTLDTEKAIAMADDMWLRTDDHSLKTERWEKGQEQANRFKEALAQELQEWLAK